MASRCFVFVVAPRQLGNNGCLNSPRLTLAPHYPHDVGEGNVQLPGHGGVCAALPVGPPKKGSARVSFAGRFVAGQFVAVHNDNVLTETLIPVKEKLPKMGLPSKPEWAKRIEAARQKLGWSQTQLAQKCGTSAMAVSRWERGENEPPGRAYVTIGNALGDPDCWYFWEQVGLSKSQIARVWPEMEDRLRQHATPTLEIALPANIASRKAFDYVPVPLLKDAASAGAGRIIDPADVEDYLFVRPRRVPDRTYTIAIKVTGSSMEPSLRDGYTVVVDVRERPPEELVNCMVLARNPAGEILVKYLRRTQGEFLLVAEHTSMDYNPVLLSREPNWSIIGRVLWWIGEPKPPRRK
jgi:phage repressor protein C with HTH and peptisase S24 domain